MALRKLSGLFFIMRLFFASTADRLSSALVFLGLFAALFIADKERPQGMFHLPGYVVRAVRELTTGGPPIHPSMPQNRSPGVGPGGGAGSP